MLKRFVRAGCGIAALACLMYSTGFAQPADKRTTFTFSGPVALPGITLPAGQYLFRLADPSGDRKVVQVLSADVQQALRLAKADDIRAISPARPVIAWPAD
jgi:hypothetical protein